MPIKRNGTMTSLLMHLKFKNKIEVDFSKHRKIIGDL